MKAVFFLIGCVGVAVVTMYSLELFPALSAGSFAFEQYRNQVIFAAVGALVAVFCFGKAAARKDPNAQG